MPGIIAVIIVLAKSPRAAIPSSGVFTIASAKGPRKTTESSFILFTISSNALPN